MVGEGEIDGERLAGRGARRPALDDLRVISGSPSASWAILTREKGIWSKIQVGQVRVMHTAVWSRGMGE
jgi:hypothetical protein